MATDEPAILLSDRSAAALLGTLWRGAQDGRFPKPVKIGGCTRWRRDELMAAIERAAAARDVA